MIESIEEQRNIMEFIDRFTFEHNRDGAMMMHRDAMHRCGDDAMRYASRIAAEFETTWTPTGFRNRLASRRTRAIDAHKFSGCRNCPKTVHIAKSDLSLAA